jgi:carbamoyl-phosphate synthase large subunit
MRASRCLREIGVETGGSNVQFAVNPKDGRLIVIEMNPRVSRSRRWHRKPLASRLPRSRQSWRWAIRSTRSTNDITGATPAAFEPTIDYVVTKIPRFAFEKFKGAEPILSTAMKSVGEVMAIGRNFHESLQKALRGLETGLTGFNRVDGAEGRIGADELIIAALTRATPDRLLVALRRPSARACRLRKFTPYEIRPVVPCATSPKSYRRRRGQSGRPAQDAEGMRRLKAMGFSDKRLAFLAVRSRMSARAGWAKPRPSGSGLLHDGDIAMAARTSEGEVRAHRHKLGVRPVFKRIDSCAAEFEAKTPYMYSTYEAPMLRRTRMRGACRPTGARSSSLAAGRTGSGRGSSSTIAASTPALRWPRRASKRSWSTAIRRRFRPITTLQTGSISSR